MDKLNYFFAYWIFCILTSILRGEAKNIKREVLIEMENSPQFINISYDIKKIGITIAFILYDIYVSLKCLVSTPVYLIKKLYDVLKFRT